MRARTDIKLKPRETLTLTDFRGIDLSTTTSRVNPHRATYMQNLINEYGSNRKRKGWEEIGKLDGSINGIFEYSYGERKELIVHAGTHFYRIGTLGGENGYNSPSLIPYTAEAGYEIENARSQAFHDGGRMYIIGCGDFLVYGTWDDGETFELRRVYECEDTYAPTTSTSIDPTDRNDTVVGHPDKVNLLTRKRVNQLVGYDTKMVDGNEVRLDDSDTVSWILDGNVDTNKPVVVKMAEADEEKELGRNGLIISRNEETTLQAIGCRFFNYEPNYFRMVADETIADYEERTGGYYLKIAKMAEKELLFYDIYTGVVEKKSYVCGQINGSTITLLRKSWCVETNSNGSIVRFGGDGLFQSNISVTFYAVTDQDYGRQIRKCTFGTLFGTGGNTDRLFLSGNPEHKNIDWHSARPNKYLYDNSFAYFEDDSASAIGTSNKAITGYVHLSDNTLATFKEQSEQDSTMFYRTGREYEDTSENTGVVVTSVFPVTSAGVGEGVVSRFACANFGGDNLILSKNGVYGIVYGSNVASAERYTRERSRNIEVDLKRRNLSNAVAIVHDNRYYLAVDDVCYIADGRYKFQREDDLDGSFNYEWWYWTNMPVRVWGKAGDVLLFGTADGRICRFWDGYSDVTVTELGSGQISVQADREQFSYNQSIRIIPQDIVRLSNESPVYAVLTDEISVANDCIYADFSVVGKLEKGESVYIDTITGQGNLQVGVDYTVCDIDVGSCCFRLKRNGVLQSITEQSFRICKKMNGKDIYIMDDTGESIKLKMYPTSEKALQFANYGGSAFPTGTKVSIIRHTPVVSEWVTPVFDMGTFDYSKTLLKMSVADDSGFGGTIEIGYETRNSSKYIKPNGLDMFDVLMFERISFDEFNFVPGFRSSYTVRVRERKFNNILFRFRSAKAVDSPAVSVSMVYKINKQNKGVE